VKNKTELLADIDRVTAERDAALIELKGAIECIEKFKPFLNAKAQHVEALQQRLTAADERADAGVAFVTRLIESAGDQPSIATGYLRDIRDALKPADGGRDEPNCLLCLDKKTVPSNLAEGYVMDCPDCCGEEG